MLSVFGQLAQSHSEGRPYSCNFGKDSSFAHVSVAGRSKDRLNDMVSAMAANVKADLT
jgi:hypothetical protein